MAISQLSLTDFRNLGSTTLDFDPTLNLISGNNGSGKTSLLEAIYVLCQARSFRTHQLKQCIRHGRESFLLFGRFDGFKVGVSRREAGDLEIHVDGQSIGRRSELVRRAPINIVNPESFAMIEGAPQQRRAYLDWCLFHVEHEYAEAWAGYQHALKQRNRLLRSRQDLELIDYWDEYLIEPTRKISGLRRLYCSELQAIVDKDLQSILQGIPLELAYRPGWNAELDFIDALKANRARDERLGYTSIGVHRDDLVMVSEGRPVAEVLSRGQGKRVCLALMLAALTRVAQEHEGRIILLIDDLNSELDPGAQRLVYDRLGKLELQLFVSNIEAGVPEPLREKDLRLFHVEHGTIKPRNFS